MCNAHCTLCMVQCESREKSTTSDQICLISFFQHAVRQRACIWRGWHVCCFRARLRWKMPALHVSSHSCFLFKAAPATTPRAETVTTKMLRLLVRSTQISVRQVSFNLKKKKMSPSWFSVVAVFPWFSAVEMVPVVPVVGISLRFRFGLVNLVKTWITRFALVNLVMSSFNTARCSTLDRRLVRQQRIWMFEN